MKIRGKKLPFWVAKRPNSRDRWWTIYRLIESSGYDYAADVRIIIGYSVNVSYKTMLNAVNKSSLQKLGFVELRELPNSVKQEIIEGIFK